MMSLPPLALAPEQAARLLTYLQTYRRHVLTQMAPSTERNAQQRLLQALQGRLIQVREQGQRGAVVYLSLSSEEVKILHIMMTDLLASTLREPESTQRSATVVDLTALKTALESLALFRPNKPFTRSLR